VLSSSARNWVLLSMAAGGLAVVSLPIVGQMPAGLIPDDGYFYAKIASNIARLGFSSFDGINPTDGYHQLWQYLLAAVAWIIQLFTPSKRALLIGFLSLDNFCLLGASYVAGRTFLERTFLLLALAGCEFLMEGHLLAFAIACAAVSLLGEISPKKSWGALGAAALIPLCRIDATVIPLALGLFLFFGKERRKGIQILEAAGAGMLVHFGLMLGLHGHLLSVSSEIKSGASSHGLRLFANLGQRTPTLPLPFEPQAVLSLVLAAASLAWLARLKSSREKQALSGLWFGTALFTLAHLCLSDVHPWYFAAAYAGFPLVLIRSLKPGSGRSLLLCGVGGCGLLLGAFFFKAFRNRGEVGPVRRFIAGVNRLVEPNETIYVVDGSGYLGYALHAHVVNGDGLVNSHAYAALLKRGELGDYLQVHGIRYFITNKPISPGQPLIDIGGLRVTQNEAYRVLAKVDDGNYFFTNFVLWRVRG
jgi:hypothetical protein